VNFFKKIFKKRSTLVNPDKWLVDALGSGSSLAGVSVNEESAMKYSAVFACVKVLSDTIASLPLNMYERLPDGGKKRATKHWLDNVLHLAPYPGISSFRLRNALQANLSLWGNAYCQIIKTQGGKILLFPLLSKHMQIKDGKYIYGNKTVERSEILHIPGFGFDGVIGKSTITLARESIGLGLATEEFGSQYFGAGTHPGAIVEHPGKLSQEAHDNLKKSLTKKYSGLGQSHKLLLLEEGMKLQKAGIPPEDSQFLETREFQLNEICRIFRVPPHMVGDLKRATFSNIEHQSIDFVVHTIRSWLVLWEQELTLNLLSPREQEKYFIEHKVDGLLRGDIKARYDAYATGRQNGWLSANDIRALENMNPINGGDIYLVPLNMVPTEKVMENEGRTRSDFIEKRSVAGRDRVTKTYVRLIRENAQTVVNRETLAIKKQIKKQRKLRSMSDFKNWIMEFYSTMPDYIRAKMGPSLQVFMETVAHEAMTEVGLDELPADLDTFSDDYIDRFVQRYISSSQGQLLALTDLDEIEQRVTEWHDKRADKVAQDEGVRASNASALLVFGAAGVTTLKWFRRGSKSCPFCRALDGKTVGINTPFVPKGAFEPEGHEKKPMKVRGPKFHPPLHQGCKCIILPT